MIGRKVFKLYLSLVLAVLVLLGQTTVFAQIATQKLTSLTIEYKIQDKPVSKIGFNLFRVADVSGDGEYTLSGDFKNYSVSLENLNSNDKLTDLANTLETYAQRDKLSPVASGETNSSGILNFTGQKTGLYLVTGNKHTLNGDVYTIQPFIVSMPSKNVDGTWNYAVIVEPKHSKEGSSTPGGPSGGGPGNPSDPNNPSTPSGSGGGSGGGGGGGGSTHTSKTVIKKWKDSNNKYEKRPTEIVVQLLKDGEVYKTAVLNEENGWTYTWSYLNRLSKWSIAEEVVPDGYTVSISQDGGTYTITNTYKDEKDDEPEIVPPVTDPTPSDYTPGNTPFDENSSWSRDPSITPGIANGDGDGPDSAQLSNDPDKLGNPNAPNNPNNKSKANNILNKLLPQTGVLWWPAGLLFIVGLVIFIVGCRNRSKKS